MYKQKSSRNRRSNSASGNKYGQTSHYKKGSNSSGKKRSYNSKSYSRYSSTSNWKSKNRRTRTERISHSRYISKATDQKQEQYIPENSFFDFKLHETLTKNISDRNYVNPTKIQDQSIPEILKGKDILGIAHTGSGKTGAFLIPFVDKVLKQKNNRVLIITPTRELANQIYLEIKKFTKDTTINSVLIIGGASIRAQIAILNKRPEFVVATPGRLLDLHKRNQIHLGSFNNVVLDEVDQMLAMGFVEDIKTVISNLSDNRQSLFFSATMSFKEEAIANELLNNPVKIESNKQLPAANVHQDIVKVPSHNHKTEVLYGLLRQTEFRKVLVFSRTKRGADSISKELRTRGVRVDSLHGDKTQHVRSKVLTKFRTDKINVLIATDVAARGIDVADITHVINYDEPDTYHDYIHRIGRTGRIGKKGTALTFVLDRGR